jgi:hypothetical protein
MEFYQHTTCHLQHSRNQVGAALVFRRHSSNRLSAMRIPAQVQLAGQISVALIGYGLVLTRPLEYPMLQPLSLASQILRPGIHWELWRDLAML